MRKGAQQEGNVRKKRKGKIILFFGLESLYQGCCDFVILRLKDPKYCSQNDHDCKSLHLLVAHTQKKANFIIYSTIYNVFILFLFEAVDQRT
jgi:hypothetical protein